MIFNKQNNFIINKKKSYIERNKKTEALIVQTTSMFDLKILDRSAWSHFET